MAKQLGTLFGHELAIAVYAAFLWIVWNWMFVDKPMPFLVAFGVIHLIKFIGVQFHK